MVALRIVLGLAAFIFWMVIFVRFCLGAEVASELLGSALFLSAMDGLSIAMRAAVGR